MKLLLVLVFLVSAVACAENICGGTYRGFQYTITSPNYPKNYSNHLNCVYRLQGDTWDKCDQEFHLQFVDFNVKSSENCKKDYLQVGDRHIFCGKVVGLRKFTGVNNSLSVVFHSDEYSADKGFKIIVTAVPCILKFNHNHFYRGFTEEGRDDFAANDVPNNANLPYSANREINGDLKNDFNNSASRSNLLTSKDNINNKSTFQPFNKQKASTTPPQINTSYKNNLSTDSSPASPPWSFSETVSSINSPRISAYFFAPPSNNNSNFQNDFVPIVGKNFEPVTPPENVLTLPAKNSLNSFSNVRFANGKNVLDSFDKSSSPSEQVRKTVGVPARNYGEPGGGLSVVDYDLQVSNDCDTNGNAASSIKNNYNSLQDQSVSSVTTKVGASSNVIYDSSSTILEPNNFPINRPFPTYPGRYQGGYPYRPPGYSSSINNPFLNYANGIPNSYNYGYNNGYNTNLGLSNYPAAGYNAWNNYPSYANGGHNLGYNSGYNPISPVHRPGYNLGVSTYNSGYNSGFSSGFLPSYTGNYYSNIGNQWGNVNGYYPQDRECCRVQSGRRFSLSSPGFPGGISSNNLRCRYTITKNSPDICRLRFNFRFFNFGAEDEYCSYGYIEIDGRRYCGCLTGQSVPVLFTDYIAKPIYIMYSGYPRSKFSGFLIDVIQEPCGLSGPPPSYPFLPYSTYSSYAQNPSYQYNAIAPNFPNYSASFQKRKDVERPALEKRNAQNPRNASVIQPSMPDPNPHIRAKRYLGYSYPKPTGSFINGGVSTVVRSQSRYNSGTCQNRIFLDWAIASKEAIFRNVRCGGIGIPILNNRYLPSRISRSLSTAPSECQEINVNQGEIRSPLYPNNYPDDVKICYRFNKIPNFCKVEINVRDFDVEPSEGCNKDYLTISDENTKYCGNTLKSYKSIFDLTQVNYMDIYFISDTYGTGRGFNISFSQLPCGLSSNI